MSNDGDNIIVIQLKDGGLGDDDLTENGVIINEGRLEVIVTPEEKEVKIGKLYYLAGFDNNPTADDIAEIVPLTSQGAL